MADGGSVAVEHLRIGGRDSAVLMEPVIIEMQEMLVGPTAPS